MKNISNKGVFVLYEDIVKAFNDGEIGLYEYCIRLVGRRVFIKYRK